MYRTLLLSFAMALGCSCSSDAQPSTWESFVSSPSPETEQRLIDDIGDNLSGCDWGKPVNQRAIPDRFRQDLFRLISEGNAPALRVGFQVDKCLDGGDLEDLNRSIGLFFDKKPDDFVKESTQANIAPQRFAKWISSLPLTLIDDPTSQLELINERVNKVESLVASIEPQMSKAALMLLTERQESLSIIVGEED